MCNFVKIPVLGLAFFSCGHNADPVNSFSVTHTAALKTSDTLYENADTIILNNSQRDTLLKYHPMSDSAYAVKPEQIHFTKKLDFSGFKFKKKYKTVITDAVREQGVNFAGHYCFVSWGCGSPCQMSAVVDLSTGKVYNGLYSGTGYGFKKNSRLLVVNPPDSTNWYYSTVFYTIPLEFVWTGTHFKKAGNRKEAMQAFF